MTEQEILDKIEELKNEVRNMNIIVTHGDHLEEEDGPFAKAIETLRRVGRLKVGDKIRLEDVGIDVKISNFDTNLSLYPIYTEHFGGISLKDLHNFALLPPDEEKPVIKRFHSTCKHFRDNNCGDCSDFSNWEGM